MITAAGHNETLETNCRPASPLDALLHLPADQWVNFELTARLGTDSDGTYDLSVTLPEINNINRDSHLFWFR
jgi:hypothetical protein